MEENSTGGGELQQDSSVGEELQWVEKFVNGEVAEKSCNGGSYKDPTSKEVAKNKMTLEFIYVSASSLFKAEYRSGDG